MNFILQAWHVAFALVSALVNHRQQQIIAFQNDQIEALLTKLGKKRVLLTDDQRRQLAVKGKAIGRKALMEVTTSATSYPLVRHADNGDGHEDLYVVSFFRSRVLRYDGQTGEFMDEFVKPTKNGRGKNFIGISAPYGARFGPDGDGDGVEDLYVSGGDWDQIVRFSGATGEKIDVFIPPYKDGSFGSLQPQDLIFDEAEEYVYVSYYAGEVVQFDAQTGALVSIYVPQDSGGITRPTGLAFDARGNLYVGSFATDEVLRYGPLSQARFDVSLSAPAGSPVTAEISTADVTAVAGEDYEPITSTGAGMLLFAPEDTSLTKTILVATINDDDTEQDETFEVKLSNPVNAELHPDHTVAIGTILDNDSATPGPVHASAETTASGTVVGSYLDTFASDNTYEAIEEIQTNGKPSKRRSLLEHRWTFVDVPAGNHTFYVEAYHTANSEGDDFDFEYSTDGSSYAHLLTVSKTADDGSVQSVELPVSGTVYVRVMDADGTPGNSSMDTIYIDHMYVETASAAAAANGKVAAVIADLSLPSISASLDAASVQPVSARPVDEPSVTPRETVRRTVDLSLPLSIAHATSPRAETVSIDLALESWESEPIVDHLLEVDEDLSVELLM